MSGGLEAQCSHGRSGSHHEAKASRLHVLINPLIIQVEASYLPMKVLL
jgi:hypothetical protein